MTVKESLTNCPLSKEHDEQNHHSTYWGKIDKMHFYNHKWHYIPDIDVLKFNLDHKCARILHTTISHLLLLLQVCSFVEALLVMMNLTYKETKRTETSAVCTVCQVHLTRGESESCLKGVSSQVLFFIRQKTTVKIETLNTHTYSSKLPSKGSTVLNLETIDLEVLCNSHGEDNDDLKDCITGYINFCMDNVAPTETVRYFHMASPGSPETSSSSWMRRRGPSEKGTARRWNRLRENSRWGFKKATTATAGSWNKGEAGPVTAMARTITEPPSVCGSWRRHHLPASSGSFSPGQAGSIVWVMLFDFSSAFNIIWSALEEQTDGNAGRRSPGVLNFGLLDWSA